MPSPILARADALMQRRSAGHDSSHDAPEDFPILTDAFDEEENIPILLQVDAAPEEQSHSPVHTATARNEQERLTADLTRVLEARLQAALPDLIARAVADVLTHRQPALADNTPTTPETGP